MLETHSTHLLGTEARCKAVFYRSAHGRRNRADTTARGAYTDRAVTPDFCRGRHGREQALETRAAGNTPPAPEFPVALPSRSCRRASRSRSYRPEYTRRLADPSGSSRLAPARPWIPTVPSPPSSPRARRCGRSGAESKSPETHSARRPARGRKSGPTGCSRCEPCGLRSRRAGWSRCATPRDLSASIPVERATAQSTHEDREVAVRRDDWGRLVERRTREGGRGGRRELPAGATKAPQMRELPCAEEDSTSARESQDKALNRVPRRIAISHSSVDPVSIGIFGSIGGPGPRRNPAMLSQCFSRLGLPIARRGQSRARN